MSKFDFREGIGLTMKSLYGNMVYSDSGVLVQGNKKKVFANYTLEKINKVLSECGFMSYNDDGLNNALKKWLYTHFPNRSRWETSEAEDRILELYKWMDEGRDYTQGVRIFEKYMHGANLIRMWRTGKSEILRKKLEYKLTHALSEL
jgi:hypothetical protein